MPVPVSRFVVFFLIHTAVISLSTAIFYYTARWCFSTLYSLFTLLGFVVNAVALIITSSASAIMITLFIRKYSLNKQNYYWMIPLYNLPACFLLANVFKLEWNLTLTLFGTGLLLTAFFAYLTYKKTANR